MNTAMLVEKIKNKLVTLVVIIVTLIVFYKLYQNQNEQMDKIKELKRIEIKKISVLKNMQVTYQGLEAYKNLLTKVLEESVVSSLSDFARNIGMQVESFKPEARKANVDYVEFPFSLTVKAKGYHDLAKFVSKIENYAQVFVITNADISSDDAAGGEITARLSLSNIVFQGNENENKQ